MVQKATVLYVVFDGVSPTASHCKADNDGAAGYAMLMLSWVICPSLMKKGTRQAASGETSVQTLCLPYRSHPNAIDPCCHMSIWCYIAL